MFKNIEGQRVPNVTFKTRRDHEWVDVNSAEIFAGVDVTMPVIATGVADDAEDDSVGAGRLVKVAILANQKLFDLFQFGCRRFFYPCFYIYRNQPAGCR